MRERREEAKGRARRHRDIAFADRARNSPCNRRGQGGLGFLALAGRAVRRLGDSAPRWPAGSPAQWQRLAEAPDVDLHRTARSLHQAKGRGWLRVGVSKPKFIFLAATVAARNKVTTKTRAYWRGCARSNGRGQIARSPTDASQATLIVTCHPVL